MLIFPTPKAMTPLNSLTVNSLGELPCLCTKPLKGNGNFL